MANLPVRLLPCAEAIAEDTTIHLLPFHIKYSGPAAVASNFILLQSAIPPVYPDEEPDDDEEAIRSRPDIAADAIKADSATFRGRLMFSTRLDLPEGYQGIAATSKAPRPSLGSSREGFTRKRPTNGSESLPKRQRLLKPKAKVVQVKYSLDSDSEPEQVGLENGDSSVNLGNSSTNLGESSANVEDTIMASPRRSPRKHTSAQNSPASSPRKGKQTAKSPSKSATFTTPLEDMIDAAEKEQQEAMRQQEEEDLPKDHMTLQSNAGFKSLRIWSPDNPLDKTNDPYWKGVNEWIALAKMIHT